MLKPEQQKKDFNLLGMSEAIVGLDFFDCFVDEINDCISFSQHSPLPEGGDLGQQAVLDFLILGEFNEVIDGDGERV